MKQSKGFSKSRLGIQRRVRAGPVKILLGYMFLGSLTWNYKLYK